MGEQAGDSVLNGVDVGAMERFRSALANDGGRADREPSLVAHWLGGNVSRIELGELATTIGGPRNLNSMQTLLASFAACEADVVALHAALIGLPIEQLEVEASGHFNVHAYLGIAGSEGAGYDRISYRVRLRAPEATAEQAAYLRERCRRSSPVGDSLARAIPLTLELEVSP